MMSWHTGAFFASLSLWAVAVLFVAPETSPEPHSAGGGARQQPCSWRSAAVTLFCAAVMSVGYCKLRLYLDEMSDALAAGRTGLNPYHVDQPAKSPAGFAFTSADEARRTQVARALLNCHDQATEFLTSYSSDMLELEDKFRTSVRMLVEDIGSWNNEIAMIVREMRVVPPAPPAPPPPSFPAFSAGSAQTPSQDAAYNDDSVWSQRAPSGSSSPSGTAPRGDSRAMLVTKGRRPNKSDSASTGSTRVARKSSPVSTDLEVADHAAAAREVPGGGADSAGRSVRRADVARENGMLNVRRRVANTRGSDDSPPEPHTFDDPRSPAAENARIELEDAVEQRGKMTPNGTTASEAEDPLGPSYGDERQKDAAPPPPTEDAATTSHGPPQLKGKDDDGDKASAEDKNKALG